MPKFRKKPVVIEAVQLRWDTWNEMCHHADVGELADGKPTGCYVNEAGEASVEYPGAGARIGLWIPTLEGLMLAIEDDWVIRGVQNEVYPCKPDIFEATYEPVEDAPPGFEYLDIRIPVPIGRQWTHTTVAGLRLDAAAAVERAVSERRRTER